MTKIFWFNICDKHYSDNYLVTKQILEQNWWLYCLFFKKYVQEKKLILWQTIYEQIIMTNRQTNKHRQTNTPRKLDWESVYKFCDKKYLKNIYIFVKKKKIGTIVYCLKQENIDQKLWQHKFTIHLLRLSSYNKF